VRQVVRERVGRLSSEEQRSKSERIAHSVLELPEVTSAGVVMAFLSLPDEVQTESLIAALCEQGKVVAVPHTDVERGQLVPVLLRPGSALRQAVLGVPEPEVQEPVPVSELEVILVPGRAFDRDGHRVGRGKGFYDRFLAREECQAERVALAYGCQVLEAVPHGSQDLPVDALVTEDGVLRFRQTSSA